VTEANVRDEFVIILVGIDANLDPPNDFLRLNP